MTARLLDTETDEILWSQTYDDDIGVRDLFTIQSDVANKVATAVAQPYGIIAQADVSNPPDDLGVYGCTLSFYAYRAELSTERHGEVRNCLESAVARYPSFATAWAMLSILYLDEDRFRFNRKPISSAPIDRSFQAARRAVQLDPGNGAVFQPAGSGSTSDRRTGTGDQSERHRIARRVWHPAGDERGVAARGRIAG
ncbi:hypothetical protein GGI55_001659 [Rhizobium leguminosarum]|nr:hypothetical protein [Rhizobium leguminosarum]MBB4431591.1 hypothetical protein [Rhizobium esperanzae]MBB4539793.1 hypothetical protein [Rhizobium leguminosarum]MBB5651814.1 hypothetical protein [Rhizobium leguminosarum]MBB5677415.1 hypothetical protein [Rhizobium leguminosarum]